MATTLVNIDVADLDGAIRFYRHGLGLRFARTLSTQIAELFAGELAVYLLEKPAGSAPAATVATTK